jgi:hypothetical protein
MSGAISTVVWNHITRKYPDAYEVSVDALEKSLGAEGHGYTRSYHLIPLFQGWAKSGFGQFKVGRRRSPTRMSFPRKVREMGDPTAAAPKAAGPAQPTAQPVELAVPLRPGLAAKLQLPADLTPDEAERICSFVRMVPLKADGSAAA